MVEHLSKYILYTAKCLGKSKALVEIDVLSSLLDT